MARANSAQRAERLNLTWTLLRKRARPTAIVQQLVRDCAISTRQANRYLQEARRLSRPLLLPIIDPKVAFTVKLPRSLVGRVRNCAAQADQSLSECVSRALLAMLQPGGRRG